MSTSLIVLNPMVRLRYDHLFYLYLIASSQWNALENTIDPVRYLTVVFVAFKRVRWYAAVHITCNGLSLVKLYIDFNSTATCDRCSIIVCILQLHKPSYDIASYKYSQCYLKYVLDISSDRVSGVLIPLHAHNSCDIEEHQTKRILTASRYNQRNMHRCCCVQQHIFLGYGTDKT